MRRLLRIILLIFNLLAVAALLLATLGQYVRPSALSLSSMLGIGFVWLVVINCIFFILWLFTQRKLWCLLPLGAILLSWSGIHRTMRFQKSFSPAGKEISVLSYNTHCLGFQSNKPIESNEVLRYIRKQRADIVCLQEFVAHKDGNRWQDVKQYLGYPYSYIDFKVYEGRRQYGLAVFSKYPLINKQTIRYQSKTNISNHCDVIIDGDTIRLFNNHLQSNMLTPKDMSLPAAEREELAEKIQEKAEEVGKKIYTNTRLRAAQAQFVRDEIAASPYPVLVCGDFNDVPVSYTYRTIADGLHDAFLESTTWQLGHTFYKGLVGIRIDYILYSPVFSVRNFQVDKTSLSDHYPIRCTLILPAK